MRTQFIGKLLVLAESKETKVQCQATTALINLNDTQTVRQVILNLGSSSPSKRETAYYILEGCRNPDILPLLSEALVVNEDPMEFLASEVRVPTRSTAAAHIIRQIITSSSAFSPATRDWARNLDRGKPELFRETMRLWWRGNDPLIQARAYDRVVPAIVTMTTNSIKRADGGDKQ
jgi:hypothetical protein